VVVDDESPTSGGDLVDFAGTVLEDCGEIFPVPLAFVVLHSPFLGAVIGFVLPIQRGHTSIR
jgi:hypothetical protein